MGIAALNLSYLAVVRDCVSVLRGMEVVEMVMATGADARRLFVPQGAIPHASTDVELAP